MRGETRTDARGFPILRKPGGIKIERKSLLDVKSKNKKDRKNQKVGE